MTIKARIIDNLNWRLPLQEAQDVFHKYANLDQTQKQKEKFFDCLMHKEAELLEILTKKAEQEGFEYTSILSISPILEWLYEGNLDFVMDIKPAESNQSAHAHFLLWLLQELGLDL